MSNFAERILSDQPADATAIVERSRDGGRREWSFPAVRGRVEDVAATLHGLGLRRRQTAQRGDSMTHAVTTVGHQVARGAILRAADSAWVNRVVSRHGMRLGARRFVPAETLDEIVPIFRGLNAEGLRAVTGLFDDYALDPAHVAAHEHEYSRQIVRLAEEGLEANVGLKLTHLGVRFDHELMFETVARLLDLARERGMRLRIDMEESEIVDATLDLYRRLRESGRDNVGVVLQSYLHRSANDLESLLPYGLNVRLVKGAYLEPPQVAFQHKPEIDAAYVALMRSSLPNAEFTAIATHDPAMIRAALEIIEREAIPDDRFEFQMLYGIAVGEQRRVIGAGLPLRLAAPYGPTWFTYLMRRLAERPANLAFFLRGALNR
jgi:proline dehydrogenase